MGRLQRSSLTIAAAMGISYLAATPVAAQEQAKIRVDYTFAAVRASGGATSPVRWSVGVTLLGGNRTVDSFEGKAGRYRSAGGGEERLGGGKWRVAGKSQLVRVTDWPNSQTIVTVVVNGQSCAATIKAHLKPGRTVYLLRQISDGSMGEFREPQYYDVSCSIS